MTIAFACPSCRKRLEVPASLAGRTGRCKQCGGPFTIPTPRALPPAGPPEDPEILDASAYEDVPATPGAAARGTGRKSGGAGRPGRTSSLSTGVDTTKLAVGIAGCLAILVGLVLVDRLTRTLARDGLGPLGRPGGFWTIAGTVLLLGAGAKGAARLLRPGVSRVRDLAGAERMVGGLVLALGVLVIGARTLVETGVPGLSRLAPRGADSNDPELNRPEHRTRVAEQVERLRSGDTPRVIAAAEALTDLRPGPPDLRQEVCTALHERFNAGVKAERPAIIRALGYWGDGVDAQMAEANCNDPDPEVSRAASEALERLKGRR